MSPDDLIAAFTELAGVDPDMRIDRAKVGDVDEIRLAGWASVRSKHKFEALSSDAVNLFAPAGDDDEVTRWLWIVRKQAPELVEPSQKCLGYAEVDGKRVEMVAETILNAAGASVLVVRRLRDAQRRRDQLTPPPIGAVDAAVVAAAQEQYPTIESALIHLSRQPEGEPVSFALTWIHSQCTWSSRRNGAELWDYIGQLSRGGIVDAVVRESVVPQLRRLDAWEHGRALWTEILSRFPHVAASLLDGKSRTPPDPGGSHSLAASDGGDEDFETGQWFTLNTEIPTARLRQAARPDRKTKRVRKRTIDGVECYSVSDARRWWPTDMTKA